MTSLIDEAADQWFVPDNLTDSDNEAICASLEALFTLPEREDYPFELSKVIRDAFGDHRIVTTVNAGDGSLMRAFDTAYCFGIEADPKQSRRRKGAYQPVVGAFAYLTPLFLGLDRKLADTIIDLREDVELDATFTLAEALIDRNDARVVIVDHGDNNAARIAEQLGRVAEIVVKDRDLRLYFLGEPKVYATPEEVPVRFADVDTLDLLGPWVEEQYTAAQVKYTYSHRRANNRYSSTVADDFKAIHREYGRRFVKDEQSWDIELYGATSLNFNPSDWARLALERAGRGDLQGRLHKKSVTYFAQNSGFWEELLILEDKSLLLIDPFVKAKVEPIVALAYQVRTPLGPLTPQARIGFISEQPEIKCLKDDEARNFKAGTYYRVAMHDIGYEKEFRTTEKAKGSSHHLEEVRKKRAYRHQMIQIDGRHNFYDDDPEHIKYLLSHFAVKDPGDIRTRFPELYSTKRAAVETVESTYLTPRGFAFKEYQRDDITRVLTKDRAILAWEQGLGKTLGGTSFALAASTAAKKNLPTLIIAPQDLIPQWKAEAKKFFGIELQQLGGHKGGKARKVVAGGEEQNVSAGAVKNIVEAREVAQRIKANPNEGGFFITHFEALTGGNAKGLRKIEEPFVVRRETRQRWVKPGYFEDENGNRRYRDGQYQDYEVEILSSQECPNCGGEMFGLTCRRKKVTGTRQTEANRNDGTFIEGLKPSKNLCGYTRISYALPTLGQILSTTFRNGTIIVDEGTQIASSRSSTEKDSSLKTKAVCGLRAKHRLVMSGTPVKNFIAQAFWLLWWAIGDNSNRFPYAYAGGKKDFAKEFTVFEWTYNEDTDGWNNVKEVGEVTNHSKLWAQLAAVLLRRVKEQTGELIPPKKIHVEHTPLGYHQREQMQFWIEHFPTFFVEKHPEKAHRKSSIGEGNARLLGLDHKLNYASVMPKADPDFDWTGVEVSNFTPATLRTLETVMALVRQGRQVLVGSDVKRATPWLAARLAEKGVSVKTMLKQDGSGDTLDPLDRADVVRDFQEGKYQVLVSTQQAIRLGHNLDQGSAVVFLGLNWDYEMYAQFRDRVHRLTSENPVDVYVIIPGEKNLTLVGRKWGVIEDKSKGASMALDGQMPERNEAPVDPLVVIREMMEKGIPSTGDEVMESACAEAWRNTSHVATFQIPDGFTDHQAKPWVIDWDAANAAMEVYLAEQAHLEMLEAAHEENSIRTGLAWISPIAEEGAATAVALFFWEQGGHNVEEEPELEVPGDVLTPAEEAELNEFIDEALAPLVEEQEEEVQEPEQMVEDLKPAPAAAVVDTSSIIQQLKDLAELHQLGVLEDDEFKEAKAALIGQMKRANSSTTEGEPQLALAI